MQEDRKEIIASIESGEFFQNSKDWYAKKYIANFTTLFYIIVLFITVAIFAFLIFKTSTFDYVLKKYPFPVFFSDEVHYFPKIKSVKYEDKNADISIARYLIAQYIQQRESYLFSDLTYERMNKKLSFIEMLSSYRVFNEFFENFDIQDNPDSPILKYKFNTERIIKIKSITFPSDVKLPDTAEVIYEAIEKTNDTKKVTNWLLSIAFVMTEIDKKVLEKKVPFKFTVIKYYNDNYDNIDK